MPAKEITPKQASSYQQIFNCIKVNDIKIVGTAVVALDMNPAVNRHCKCSRVVVNFEYNQKNLAFR